MSSLITNSSIIYGSSKIISVIILTSVSVLPSDSVVSIETTLNGTLITVAPLQSTLYEISGYDAFGNLQNFNETIYVTPVATAVAGSLVQNANPDQYIENQSITLFPYNSPITMTVSGASTVLWYPSIYLNTTSGSVVICTPLDNITYTIQTTDTFNNTNILYMTINIIPTLSFNPPNPNVYQGNLFKINVSIISNLYNNNSVNYVWRPTNTNYLPVECGNYKYGMSLTLNPMQTVTYVVSAYNNSNNSLICTGTVKITIIIKSPALLDLDILPYNLVPLILSRNKRELTKELVKDKVLSKKIISFYYNTLQTAYRMEWTDKNGAPYRMNWTTFYDVQNEINIMLINFEQQWRLFKYINAFGNRSNFYFLLNTVNQIYLEFPQKIGIYPLEGASDWIG
jgi:hypothetical protein